MNLSEKKDPKIISKPDRDLETYVKDRVEYKINKYEQCAGRHRRIYWTMASTSAVGAAVVPALVNLSSVPKLATTIVSLIVAITVALERLFRPREQWRNYDLISALLREEEMKFSTRSGPYCRGRLKETVNNPQPGSADEDAFAKFVERVEDAIHREREETIVMRTAQDAPARDPTER
jgi:hypothetical protein